MEMMTEEINHNKYVITVFIIVKQISVSVKFIDISNTSKYWLRKLSHKKLRMIECLINTIKYIGLNLTYAFFEIFYL